LRCGTRHAACGCARDARYLKNNPQKKSLMT
jgi:hypothetical protein